MNFKTSKRTSKIFWRCPQYAYHVYNYQNYDQHHGKLSKHGCHQPQLTACKSSLKVINIIKNLRDISNKKNKH